MTDTLIQMSLLMACGVVWRIFQPASLAAEQVRSALTSVVYYLLMPAMILAVLWQTRLSSESWHFIWAGMAGILSALIGLWLLGKLGRWDKKTLGTLILAGAFPNVTYLGLPILEQTFGEWVRPVVIQVDLFAASPILYTLGIAVARHYGTEGLAKSSWGALNAPPFWTAAVAVSLNLGGVDMPTWLLGALQKLSAAAAPLMIFSLGLALDWRNLSWRNLPYMVPLLLIKMLVLPLLAWWLMGFTPLDAAHRAAAVMDLAMPSMLLGVVFCDRYKLDSPLYAMAVTVTTLASLFVLPVWHQFFSTH